MGGICAALPWAWSESPGLGQRWRPGAMGTRREGAFFIALDDRLMAVPIALPATAGSAEPGAPTPLFGTSVGGAVQSFSRQQYFVSPDGQRFLMNTILQTTPLSPITVIVNWAPRAAVASQ